MRALQISNYLEVFLTLYILIFGENFADHQDLITNDSVPFNSV